jgi:hypothetical protein
VYLTVGDGDEYIMVTNEYPGWLACYYKNIDGTEPSTVLYDGRDDADVAGVVAALNNFFENGVRP